MRKRIEALEQRADGLERTNRILVVSLLALGAIFLTAAAADSETIRAASFESKNDVAELRGVFA